MRFDSVLVFVILAFTLPAFLGAQSPQSTKAQDSSINPAAGTPEPLRIHALGSELKQTVAFLSVTYVDQNQLLTIKGTGFFVYYEDKRLGADLGFLYLVTNRHMADPKVDGHSVRVLQASVRVNLRAMENGRGSIDLSIPVGPASQWIYPSDPAVDLAILPVGLDQNRFDVNPFPVSLFATKDVIKTMGVAEGDSVTFAGFFYQLPGMSKVEPIVRQGVLAMMPDEQMTTTLGGPGFLYLADMHVFGGNSGSPVFVNVMGNRGGMMLMGGFPYRLLGVVSGYFFETQDFSFQIATTVAGRGNANSGISMIVPAYEIESLLNAPETQGRRDEAVKRQPKKSG